MGWQVIAVYAAIFAIQATYRYLNKAKQAPAIPPAMSPTRTVKAGTPIPLIYGSVTVTDPTIVYASPPKLLPATQDTRQGMAQTILFILGVPPVVGSTVDDKMLMVLIDGIPLETGFRTPPFPGEYAHGVDEQFDTPYWYEENQTFWDKLSNPFDDSRPLSSGLIGFVTYENGVATNSDLGYAQIVEELGAELAAQWPNYKRQMKVLFWNVVPGGFNFGGTGTLPQIAMRVRAGTTSPVDAIEDLITSDWGRAALPSSAINAASFAAARATLLTEQNQYSNIISDPQHVREHLQDIVEQIDAALFIEPETQEFHLKLIRQDYDINTIPVLDPSIIEQDGFDYAMATWTGGYNQVSIHYTSELPESQLSSARLRTKDPMPQERTLTVQDMAAIQGSADSAIRAVTIYLPGVRDDVTAGMVATRALKALSTPLATVKLLCNRGAANLRPGDPFRLTWPEYNIAGQVFRVQGVDLGSSDDRRVTVTAVRDTFDITTSLLDPDLGVSPPPALVLPIERRFVTEAPRWFISRLAQNGGPSPGRVDGSGFFRYYQRGLYLALPAQETSSGYLARAFNDSRSRDGADAPELPYLAHFLLASPYQYDTAVYDTTVEITVSATAEEAAAYFRTATTTEISLYGKNLILVDDEVMAYESATDIGGGFWRLNNIWRGLLDTTPRDHEFGAVVWMLSDDSSYSTWDYLGHHFDWESFTPFNTHLLPRNQGRLIRQDAYGVETDVFAPVRGRANLPYPPADMKVNALKTLTLEEEGIVVTWNWRELSEDLILRGDTGSQALAPTFVINNTIYVMRAPALEARGPEFSLQAVGGDSLAETELLNASIAGSGTIIVAGRTSHVVSGTDPTAWQDNEIRIESPPWRNLCLNPRFAFDGGTGDGWNAITGEVIIGADSDAHGQTGFYVRSVMDGLTDHPNIEWEQIVRLNGWGAQFKKAEVDFYDVLFAGDAEDPDEVTVTIEAYDEDDVLLGSSAYGPAAAGGLGDDVWQRHTATYSPLPAGTEYLKVRFLLESVEEPPLEPTLGITDFALRVGHFTPEQMSNGDFSSFIAGAFTLWTVDSGNFTQELLGANGYNGSDAARGGTSATNEMHQDRTVPAGYQANSTAVLEIARMNDNTDTGDTGQVILEARSSGGTVLASTQTADEQITPQNQWVRRTLSLEMPLTTDHVRVRIIAKRTAGSGTVNTLFDDVRLKFHKHLELDERDDADFREPATQRLPRDPTEWPEAVAENGSGAPIPDYGFWDGSDLGGKIGIEPRLGFTAGQQRAGKFLGCWDPERATMSTTAFEFHPTDDGLFTSVSDFNYASFDTSQSFTAVAFIRKRTRAEAAYGILGRLDATAGWSLQIDSSGRIEAFVRGSGGTATATRSASVSDGAVHLAAIIYDADTDTLTVVDEFGSSNASTASVGDIESPNLPRFRLGKAATTQSCLPGQIGRVYLWRSALDVSDVQALFTVGSIPGTMPITGFSQDKGACSYTDDDVDGVLYSCFGPVQVAAKRLPQGGPDYFGVPLMMAVNNLSQHGDLTNTATWVRETVLITDGFMSPTGFYDAIRIAADNTAGVRMAVTTANADPITVVWFARGGSAHNARVVLENGSSVNKGTHTYAVTTSWQRFQFTFTGWDFSTATARIRFLSSDTGSNQQIDLAGPIVITQSTDEVLTAVAYAVGAATATEIVLVPAMTAAYNHEGSLIFEGNCSEPTPATRNIMTLSNGTNDNDKRLVTTAARFTHYDGSGTPVNSDGTADYSDPIVAHARWNRSDLQDAVTGTNAGLAFAGFAAVYGRTSTFSASAVALDVLTLHGCNLDISRILLTSREARLQYPFPELP